MTLTMAKAGRELFIPVESQRRETADSSLWENASPRNAMFFSREFKRIVRRIPLCPVTGHVAVLTGEIHNIQLTVRLRISLDPARVAPAEAGRQHEPEFPALRLGVTGGNAA